MLTAAAALAPLAIGLLGACLRTLRSIDRRMANAERHGFTQDLHILDHEQRIDALEPHRRAS